MKTFAFEKWDDGRLTVNAEHTRMLRAAGLVSFDDFMNNDEGEVAKDLLAERTTMRLSLPGPDGQESDYYLKRHRDVPWREYVKPWFRFTRPIIGARNEWNAILEFHRANIPTMVPVAFGEGDHDSFLLTEGIPYCRKLSDWMQLRFDSTHSLSGTRAPDDLELLAVVDEIASLARRMHRNGLHHQDFYLTHLLLPVDDRRRGVHVIDLGRARKRRRLSRRWIVKDLAQLNYSAPLFPVWARDRFLERYLNRPLRKSDRRLIERIKRKTARIARHSAKHRL
ncbi:MAG: lipopolysaccharide kinase InaA family protein [Planctomycetaceae bacterium]